MAIAKIPAEVVVDFAREHPTWTNQEVGSALGISEAAVRRAFSKIGADRHELVGRDLPIEKPIRYSLAQGDIALAGDLHVPITKWSFLNRFMADTKAEGIKTLGIPGDFWNADQASEFEYKQSAADMATEKEVGTEVMTAFLEQFDRVILSWGNHDARYHKRLRYGVDFITTMKMLFEGVPDKLLDKVQWTNLDHFYVEDGVGDPWYICHPKSYSQVPLTQARRIASKMLCNVVTAHSHHHAVGSDVSGKYICAEVGGFFDRDRTEYLLRSTQFPNWQNGYAVIRQDNSISMRSEKWTY